jgi:hypothetical protein
MKEIGVGYVSSDGILAMAPHGYRHVGDRQLSKTSSETGLPEPLGQFTAAADCETGCERAYIRSAGRPG